MKTLKNLTAEAGPDAAFPRAIAHGVHEEVKPGKFRSIRLTRDALVVHVGLHAVAIPFAELLPLVEQFEPGLKS